LSSLCRSITICLKWILKSKIKNKNFLNFFWGISYTSPRKVDKYQ
jgi:hypothetical protein